MKTWKSESGTVHAAERTDYPSRLVCGITFLVAIEAASGEPVTCKHCVKKLEQIPEAWRPGIVVAA